LGGRRGSVHLARRPGRPSGCGPWRAIEGAAWSGRTRIRPQGCLARSAPRSRGSRPRSKVVGRGGDGRDGACPRPPAARGAPRKCRSDRRADTRRSERRTKLACEPQVSGASVPKLCGAWKPCVGPPRAVPLPRPTPN
jgi:hypothetical protein